MSHFWMFVFYVTALCVTACANYLVVNVVRRSELFSEWRAYFEARGGFISRVLACSYCTSFWTAMPLALPAVIISALYCPFALWWLPNFWFFTVFGSNLIHDALRSIDRTPKVNIEHDLDQLSRIADAAFTDTTGSSALPGHPAGGDDSQPAGGPAWGEERGYSD